MLLFRSRPAGSPPRPDHGDERGAGPAAAEPAADSAGRRSCPTPSRCSRAIATCLARPNPCGHAGAFGGGAADVARRYRRLGQARGLIGFGDPLFNAEQAAEAHNAEAGTQLGEAATRGLPFGAETRRRRDRRECRARTLPRLPDTADELKSIALALQADPSKVLISARRPTKKR